MLNKTLVEKDIMFNGDVVKKGDRHILVTDTGTVHFHGIDLRTGISRVFLYDEPIKVIAIGDRHLDKITTHIRNEEVV